jgi:predicted ATPase with chaperone activity
MELSVHRNCQLRYGAPLVPHVSQRYEEISMKIQPAVLVLSTVLAGALTLGVALPLRAQDNKPQQQPAPTQQTEISQSQLEAFASVVLQVREIRSRWQSRMQGAESTEKAKEIQEQAAAELVSAVEEKGLTVEKYNAIVTAARDNPELASRIAKLMEQAR